MAGQSQTRFCGECGVAIASVAKFCSSCGTETGQFDRLPETLSSPPHPDIPTRSGPVSIPKEPVISDEDLASISYGEIQANVAERKAQVAEAYEQARRVWRVDKTLDTTITLYGTLTHGIRGRTFRALTGHDPFVEVSDPAIEITYESKESHQPHWMFGFRHELTQAIALIDHMAPSIENIERYINVIDEEASKIASAPARSRTPLVTAHIAVWWGENWTEHPGIQGHLDFHGVSDPSGAICSYLVAGFMGTVMQQDVMEEGYEFQSQFFSAIIDHLRFNWTLPLEKKPSHGNPMLGIGHVSFCMGQAKRELERRGASNL